MSDVSSTSMLDVEEESLLPNGRDMGCSFIARQSLKLRSKCELDSEEAGTLPTGAEAVLLELKTLEDGTLRARVAGEPQPPLRRTPGKPLGWVSCVGKDLRSNLVPMGSAAASAALPCIPRQALQGDLASTHAGGAPFLAHGSP